MYGLQLVNELCPGQPFCKVSLKASFMGRLIREADASHCWSEKRGEGVQCLQVAAA